MPEYTPVSANYISLGDFKVFVASRASFTSLEKGTNPQSERQEQFEAEVLRLAEIQQSTRLPVFVQWNNCFNRMDRGCIGHALASGFVTNIIRNNENIITHVEIRG